MYFFVALSQTTTYLHLPPQTPPPPPPPLSLPVLSAHNPRPASTTTHTGHHNPAPPRSQGCDDAAQP
ncbi:hypothetical protein E2C01_071625 [Portunus trituberculatus]|uniref:Uncharacterized protein n=1 Tax=Portunus trituberculatus TaxID=210409 RepID=A0A5B7I5L7_PORTR|nr:hypothetical protein [Portunus trituberculatus]